VKERGKGEVRGGRGKFSGWGKGKGGRSLLCERRGGSLVVQEKRLSGGIRGFGPGKRAPTF